LNYGAQLLAGHVLVGDLGAGDEKRQEALLHEGYIIATSGKGFLSTPITDEDVDGFVSATDRICARGW
jgi:glutamate-1-semialdehyde aminotransferase